MPLPTNPGCFFGQSQRDSAPRYAELAARKSRHRSSAELHSAVSPICNRHTAGTFLRARLGISENVDDDHYDAKVAAAVRRFQEGADLKPTGCPLQLAFSYSDEA